MRAISNKSEPILFVFSGLPGVGKSSIARELARKTAAVYFRVDSVEVALKNSSLRISPAEDAGYEIGYALAKDNLEIGLSLVADCVNPIKITRDAWRQVARISNARIIEIEVICSDKNQHKAMIEKRIIENPNSAHPNWQDVVSHIYEPREDQILIIDNSLTNIDDAICKILELI